MKNLGKIFGLSFMILSILLIVYLSFSLDRKDDIKINVIELNGDSHLKKSQYFKFANLDKPNEFGNLTLSLIKDRLEKHPYVNYAEVKYDGQNKVTVNIFEKTIEAILIINSMQYFITGNLEVIPFLPFTNKVNYPVVSNPLPGGDLKNIKSVKKESDIITGLKILTTLKLVNPGLYAEISEIDLRNGKDIVMFFSNLDYPVVVGRKNEIKKTLYLNSLWSYLKGKDVNDYMNYIDLRFNEHVYLGLNSSPAKSGNTFPNEDGKAFPDNKGNRASEDKESES